MSSKGLYSFRPFCKKKNSFFNPYIDCTRKKLRHVLLWQLGYYKDKNTFPPLPLDFCYPNPQEKPQSTLPQVTWINHSTFFIRFDEFSLLTDPIWSWRCSPVNFLGPKRRHLPSIALQALPPLTLVLISHNHYDHLDKKTVDQLHYLYPSLTWVVPLGIKKWFVRRGIHRVIELAWWEESILSINDKLDLIITAVPAQHFSGRTPFTANRTLWAGYVLEFQSRHKKRKRLYFAGDTGYNGWDFKAIGERFKKMDLSLLPIGTYMPHVFMDPVHVDPEKSVMIHEEVHSMKSIGMHWQTFRLSDEEMQRPPYDLYLALQKKGIDPLSFRVLNPGQTINW